jgi:MFS family permease
MAVMLILGGILAQGIHSSMQDPASWAAFAAKARELHRITEQAGAVLGSAVGWAIGRRRVSFEIHGSWWRRLVCWVLGCAPLGVIYVARKLGPADFETVRAVVRFAGAFLSTGLLMCVVPWLCLRWKLVKPAHSG